MSIIQFLEENGIAHTKEGKHARPGWAQVQCPFCSGHEGWHGGFNLASGYYHCWRCGWHNMVEVITTLAGVDIRTAKAQIRQYELLQGEEEERAERREGNDDLLHGALPKRDTDLFIPLARVYLINRHFDPTKLLEEWGVYSTGITGKYKFRIVIPIYFKDRLVSFTTRAVYPAETKYLSCPMQYEVVHHKHILYGMDKAKGDRVLVLEGPTDVWRFGPGSVATFGIKYTPQQLLLLARTYKHVTVMFDPEDQAQAQAHKLCAELLGLGIDAKMHDVWEVDSSADDPADVDQSAADSYMAETVRADRPTALDALAHARLHGD